MNKDSTINSKLNINKQINILQKKINFIKSKKLDINNDEKILLLEAKIKELIIQKLSLY